MSIADEVKKMTEEAREKQRVTEETIRKTEAEENWRRCEAVRQQVIDNFPKVLTEIEEAAKKGKNYHFINIYQWQSDTRDPSGVNSAEASEYKRLLTEAGFSFEDRYDTTEPCGSDPLFYNTVYSYDIKVQW